MLSMAVSRATHPVVGRKSSSEFGCQIRWPARGARTTNFSCTDFRDEGIEREAGEGSDS